MRRKWLICLALAAITLAVYWPVRHHDFVCYDDNRFITENPIIQAGLNRLSVSYALASTVVDNWHPVTVLSHILDCELFGVNPGAMHLVNVAFHIANALLLFLLLHRMTDAVWRSAMVASLFALHPLHVESVAAEITCIFWIASSQPRLPALTALAPEPRHGGHHRVKTL